MPLRSTCGALLLVLGLGRLALTQPATSSLPQEVGSGRIGELIQQLGSAKFQERSAAQKELEGIGAAALEQLKKSVSSADLETSKRAGELVRKIEEKLFTAGLLAPKRVRLEVADAFVLDAVNELARLSGYSIQVVGDRTKVGAKKITLDARDVTFWQALDMLCSQAGLIESVQTPTPALHFDDFLPGKLPAQILPVLPPPKPRPAPQLRPEIKQPNNVDGKAKPAPVQPVGGANGNVGFKIALAQALPLQGAPIIQVQLQNRLVEIDQLPAMPAAGGITLVPGTPRNQHVSYAGSVRARVYPLGKSKPGEYRLNFEAAAEPRLQGFTILGVPSIAQAVDDHGQHLFLDTEVVQQNPVPVAPAARARLLALREMGAVSAAPIQRQVTLRFKAGERGAKRLKELSGNFTAQVIAAPEALMTVNNVLKAAGESVQGKSGGMLKLSSVDKLPNGDYKVQIYLESPPTSNPMAALILGNGVIQVQQVQIQVGPFGGPNPPLSAHGLPELLDAKGAKFQVVQIPSRRMHANNAAVSQEATIVFRGKNGQGEPDRLVVHGSRAVNVTVPFDFHNVPLE